MVFRLGALWAALAALALAAAGGVQALTLEDYRSKNVVLFISDQERATMHFPVGWEAANMPATTALKRHGLTFDRAFTSSCMCSPARATLFTGLMPAQHGVRFTLEDDMPEDIYSQVELDTDLTNLATLMSAAGYDVVFKGKWHLVKATGNLTDAKRGWVPEDVNQYGWTRWNPADAGANQDLDEGAAGDCADTTCNDLRFMTADGDAAAGDEGALPYLTKVASPKKPFFLVISLVNPHDVLFYPNTWEAAGYPATDLVGDIKVPSTYNENLRSKPKIQSLFVASMNLGDAANNNTCDPLQYLNFYANLIASTDEYVADVMEALARRGLIDDTLIIKTGDHGELGMSHGGMRQKNYNMYEETLRVPLIFSNPKLFPKPLRTSALVSHVDLAPTLAALLGTPKASLPKYGFTGRDYSSILLDPVGATPIQDYVMFTYDDHQAGQAQGAGGGLPQPTHVVAIREKRWKLGRYFDPAQAVTGTASEYEFYDLQYDPLEVKNLAAPGFRRNAVQQREFARMLKKLAAAQAKRLRPLTMGKRFNFSLDGQVVNVKPGLTSLIDSGNVTGVPTAFAETLAKYTLFPLTGKANSSFTIYNGAGMITGTSVLTYTQNSTNIAFDGIATITGGTGAFRGIQGRGIKFHDEAVIGTKDDPSYGTTTYRGEVTYSGALGGP